MYKEVDRFESGRLLITNLFALIAKIDAIAHSKSVTALTMKLFALVLATLAATAVAQDYNITSLPFRLFIKSNNATLNG